MVDTRASLRACRFKSGSLYTREVNRSGYCHIDRDVRAILIQYEAADRITRVRIVGDEFDIALFILSETR